MCNILAGESDFYIEQAIDNDILERFDGVLRQMQPDDMAQVVWGISNIATHNQQTAKILVADEIFLTVAQLLKSSSVRLRKEAVMVIDNVLRTLELD